MAPPARAIAGRGKAQCRVESSEARSQTLRYCWRSPATGLCDGIVFFESMAGNNNQYSFQHFLIQLIRHLDQHHSQWRSTHLLLLDNMAGHTTDETKAVLNDYNVKHLFSAPASFLAIPIEQVFFDLKITDFMERGLPANIRITTHLGKPPSKREVLLAQVATHFFNLKITQIHKFFCDRLLHLSHFLAKKKV